jgi:hypothetical protein
MLVNLDALSVWALVLAEVIALGLWGITLWRIAKPPLRRRIPGALGVIAALSLVQAEIQQRGWRVAVWLFLMTGLALALSALGKRGGLYARYWEIEQKYGEKSKEMNSLVMKAVACITVILVALMILSAVFIKGAYSQGG